MSIPNSDFHHGLLGFGRVLCLEGGDAIPILWLDPQELHPHAVLIFAMSDCNAPQSSVEASACVFDPYQLIFSRQVHNGCDDNEQSDGTDEQSVVLIPQ